MANKKLTCILMELLNETDLRSKLREKVPQIDKLESLDVLKDLRLISMTAQPILYFNYEGIATEKIYPHVRANLIKSGVINENNAISAVVFNKGKSDEYEKIRFGFLGGYIQVVLNAYNPNYKF